MALQATGSYFVEQPLSGAPQSQGSHAGNTQLSVSLVSFDGLGRKGFEGFTLTPLSHQPLAHAVPGQAFRQWLIATPAPAGAGQGVAYSATLATAAQPAVAAALPAGTPSGGWDGAHDIANRNNYAQYIEPVFVHIEDILSPDRGDAIAAPNGGFVRNTDDVKEPYPPASDSGWSPAWHLTSCGLDPANRRATGIGIRIAHLDTGYWKDHVSTPRSIETNLAFDFWNNEAGAIDCENIPIAGLSNPGHGTATLALLAGNTVKLDWNSTHYQGDLGVAPDATIVPVRIGPGVAHFGGAALANGLYWAAAPGGDETRSCDVVTLSHGGVPVTAWANAVNHLYEMGIVVVAAAGDSFVLMNGIPILTHYTVYPSAFNRVVTAVGITAAGQGYTCNNPLVMQGSWGPRVTMQKAIAAPTPNVPWMRHLTKSGWDMDGGGTSASTPQVAAACALWLQMYGKRVPKDWRRVEACRLALFRSAKHKPALFDWLGNGALDIPSLLDEDLANAVIAEVMAPDAEARIKAPIDEVRSPVARILLGWGAPNSDKARMYETELTQLLNDSSNPALVDHLAFERDQAVRDSSSNHLAQLKASFLAEFVKEPMSQALRKELYG